MRRRTGAIQSGRGRLGRPSSSRGGAATAASVGSVAADRQMTSSCWADIRPFFYADSKKKALSTDTPWSPLPQYHIPSAIVCSENRLIATTHDVFVERTCLI